jgi:hypothetical protein
MREYRTRVRSVAGLMPAREFVVRCAQAVALAGWVPEAAAVDVDGAVRSVAALGRIFHCARAALVTVVTVAGAVPLQRGLQSAQLLSVAGTILIRFLIKFTVRNRNRN